MATADPKVIEQCRAAITRSAFNPNAPRYLVDALRAAYAELTGRPAPSAPCLEHATCRAYAEREQSEAAAGERLARMLPKHTWPQCLARRANRDGSDVERCILQQGHETDHEFGRLTK